ncbi:MAG: hypothetical protein Q4A08_00210 [Bacteroidales bacterium]|nr:hypothetical protein [Bacteroidales bacterium]
MKIINNKILPFGKNYLAINLFGVIFTKGHLSVVGRNHEFIHTLQQREMLWIFFYVWYLLEWLIRLIQYHTPTQAYLHISFEKEAYYNESRLDYRFNRPFWAWRKYLTNK